MRPAARPSPRLPALTIEPAADATVDPAHGLTVEEAARRHWAGLGNNTESNDPRPLSAILRANVLTRFNLLLGVLGVAIVATGALRDALFAVVAIVNTAIGVVQELRARRTLRRLELLQAPTATVVRSGLTSEIDVGTVVLGDVLVVERGDQIAADGRVLTSGGLEVDESLLTGESEAIAKRPGDRVLSGSAVVAGAARYLVTAVSRARVASGLVAQAREFAPVRSEIRRGTERILRVVTWLLVPTAVLLLWSQLVSNEAIGAVVAGTVAGVVSMVPEGLVLLTTVAMAVGVVRLGRRRMLTRDLAALEGLARVDVLCIDKTGTLTEPGLVVQDIILVGEADEATVRNALGALARSDDSRNPTADALARACSDPGWDRREMSAFSSERKWSGADFVAEGVWIVGAADVLLSHPALIQQAEELAATGARTLAIGRATSLSDGPRSLAPEALVALVEPIRPDAAATLAYLTQQGVHVKVVSGDHPQTVTAVAQAVGLNPVGMVDARRCRSEELLDAAMSADVIGRADPVQKAAIVEHLQASGKTVAMIGDGVNDLLALKRADVGVAMGSGSSACRAVAQLVLLDDHFGAVPQAVREGRQVIGNVERVAKLFVVKSVYAFLLAVAVGVAQLPFPVLPRHLTLVAGLTIGIPGFFLALEPNEDRARPGFVDRVVRFAVPVGLVAAIATFVA